MLFPAWSKDGAATMTVSNLYANRQTRSRSGQRFYLDHFPVAATSAPTYLLDYSAGTFARPSIASIFHEDQGWLETFAVDVPRLFSDGSIFVEGAKANLAHYSGDLTQWDEANGCVASATSVIGIDGTTAAGEVRHSSLAVASAADRSRLTDDFATNSGTAQVSVYGLILDGRDPDFTFYYAGNTFGNPASVAFLPNRWVRFSTEITSAGGTGTWGIALGNLGFQDFKSRGIVLDYFQVENSGFPTSPFATSGGSAIRSDDDLTYGTGTWDTRISTGAWEIDLWPSFSSSQAPTQAHIIDIGGGTDLLRFVGTKLQVLSTTARQESAELTWDAGQKLTVKVDHVAETIEVTGATTGNGLTENQSTSYSWATTGTLRVSSTTVGNEFFGRISRPRLIG